MQPTQTKPWMLMPLVVFFGTWILASVSPTIADMCAENGFLTPSTSHPTFALPGTDGMGIRLTNLMVLTGLSILLSALVWAYGMLDFTWDEIDETAGWMDNSFGDSTIESEEALVNESLDSGDSLAEEPLDPKDKSEHSVDNSPIDEPLPG